MANKKTRNIKIDCVIARHVAEKMADITFGKQYRKALALRTKALEEFIISYLPEHMLDNPDTFYAKTNNVAIRINYGKKCFDNIYGKVSFFLPAPREFEIECNSEDCKDLIKADEEYSIVSNNKSLFESHVEDILLSLKTEEEVKKQLPEAAEYIVSTEEIKIARIKEEILSKECKQYLA